MATCPRCHDFLGDDHVCRGVARRRLRDAAWLIAAALAGVVLGGLVFAALGSVMAMRELEVVGMVLGPVVAVILVRAFRAV
jgi:hypothetical protein